MPLIMPSKKLARGKKELFIDDDGKNFKAHLVLSCPTRTESTPKHIRRPRSNFRITKTQRIKIFKDRFINLNELL